MKKSMFLAQFFNFNCKSREKSARHLRNRNRYVYGDHEQIERVFRGKTNAGPIGPIKGLRHFVGRERL